MNTLFFGWWWVGDWQAWTGRYSIFFLLCITSPPAMSGGHFIFFPRWSEEQKWFLYSTLYNIYHSQLSWSQTIFYNNQVLLISNILPIKYHVEFSSKMAPILPYVSHVFHPNNMSAIQLLLLRSTDKTQTTITISIHYIRVHNKKQTRYEARITEDVTWCKKTDLSLSTYPYQA